MKEVKIITELAKGLVVGYGATGIARLDIQYNLDQDMFYADCTIYKLDFHNTTEFRIYGDGEITKTKGA